MPPKSGVLRPLTISSSWKKFGGFLLFVFCCPLFLFSDNGFLPVVVFVEGGFASSSSSPSKMMKTGNELGLSADKFNDVGSFLESRQAVQTLARLNETDSAGRLLYFLRDGERQRSSKFSWRQCGAPTDPIAVQSLGIFPDPIRIPGSMDIYLKTTVGTDLVSPVELDLQMEFHMGVFWAHVPCRGNVGSCRYDDLCSFIAVPPTEPCPPGFNSSNVPCRCPIPANKYKLNKLTLDLNFDPSSVPAGFYFVKANMFSKSQRLACLEIYFDLSH